MTDHHHKHGQISEVQDAGNEVLIKEAAEHIRPHVEEIAQTHYESFTPTKFNTQLQSEGLNYQMKINVGGDKYIHVKCHRAAGDNKQYTVKEVVKDRSASDPLFTG